MIKRTDEINSILINMEERKKLIDKARLKKIHSMQNDKHKLKLRKLEKAFYLNAQKEDREHKTYFWAAVTIIVLSLAVYQS